MSRSERDRFLDQIRVPLDAAERAALRNRLKSARGHLEHIVEAVESEQYVIDVLRQIAAVRGALDAVIRVQLRAYFLSTFANAVAADRTDAAVDELMGVLTFLRHSASPGSAAAADGLPDVDEREPSDDERRRPRDDVRGA